MSADPFPCDVHEVLSSFIDDGLIHEILFEVKSGKEATVHCCSSPRGLLAAKVYRPIETRRFKNDAVYTTGRMHLARAGRAQRAADAKSAFGREVQYATWIEHEWRTMRMLHEAGADVPCPVARNDRAILMPFLGDERGAAPKLNDVELDREAARQVVDRLLDNVEFMLDRHVVHGDLSPFNILYWNGQATIIDFPQAVDPRLNPAALSLLRRDVANLCAWARKRGVARDEDHIVRGLWSRFTLGELG
jgi:RIO kinase 1